MPSNRTLVVIGAAVGGAAIGFAVAASAVQNDPATRVGSVSVGPVPSGALQPSASAATAQQVPGLDELAGTFTYDGDDRDEFQIRGVDLELGPERWLHSAGPMGDFDGDGREDPLLAELQSLVGTQTTALVRLDDDGDDADVFVLAGTPFRDTTGGSAPWRGTTNPVAPVPGSATPDEVQQAAEAAVGPGARAVDIDREDDPGEAWEVEVISAEGREFKVELDAAAGVLRVRED